MATSIQIHATAGNGQTLQKFGEILQKRMQYMNETARGSIAACALQVLRSIRTVTLVAKLSKVKPELKQDNTMYASYFTHGKKMKVPCIRMKGSNSRYRGEAGVIFAQSPTRGMDKLWQIWQFDDELAKKPKKYLIASPNKVLAVDAAKRIINKRLSRYAGLAKRAISLLMQKTWSKPVKDNVSQYVTAKADQLTSKHERVSTNKQSEGGTYTLTLLDSLDYAIEAIRGGKAQVDIQMKKAMNKIVSVINHKIPDANTFFSPQKLETPFPSLVRKRK